MVKAAKQMTVKTAQQTKGIFYYIAIFAAAQRMFGYLCTRETHPTVIL